MSSTTNIKVYTNHEILRMNLAEFRDFLRGPTNFYEVKIIQSTFSGALQNIYVSIRRQPVGTYKCSITGCRHIAEPVVTREDLWATLTYDYGLWTL